MGDREEIFWVEQHTEQLRTPVGLKRKAKTKKMEYVGWGSRPLLEFLESVGSDTSKKISQYDVAAIVNKYVNDNELLHPVKKKRIVCDDSLLSLFGRKTIARNKIYDMLGPHLVENQVDSDDDFLFSSEEDVACESQKKNTLERKPSEKKVLKTPKSEFAAIIPDNIKLIYLKRSLVEELLKDSETFEEKIVGSIVRVKSDPYDYLQKNSHMLVQVTGLKNVPGSNGNSTKLILQISNIMKDVHISMLSEDNFSEEECKDLRQRIIDGLLKRLTIVELKQKVQLLHKDITNHWLVKELALLEKKIDKANEKGWRRELFEYLERKQLLQTSDEQSRLLREVPKIIADEIGIEGATDEFPDDIEKRDLASPESTLNVNGSWKILKKDVASKETPSACVPFTLDSAGNPPALALTKQNSEKESQQSVTLDGEQRRGIDVITENKDFQHSVISEDEQNQPTDINIEKKDCQDSVIIEEQKKPTANSTGNKDTMDCHNVPMQSEVVKDVPVINLSDDDEELEDSSSDIEILDYDLESFIWHYLDPQGIVQGPFSIRTLKRWYDDEYFPPDFKVWKSGQSQKEAVTLTSILQVIFHH